MRKCRQIYIAFIIFFAVVLSPVIAQAIPTQFGDSGLVSQPTAETLNSGNICVGILGNCADNDGQKATVLPVFMTLGLGSFLEAYGSYPNILFNEDETGSGRGYSNVGFKIRVFGKRSSSFKLAVDGQLRRTVSSNINYDGLTDKVYRAIASYNNGTFGIHGNAGYISPESPQYISYDKQWVYGGGVEYLPTSRLRLLTEIGIETSKSEGLSDRAEVTAGFQYFFTPHLTLNLAIAKGFADESPNWRALFGFSSCQGIGTYQKPVRRKIQPPPEVPVEEKVEENKLKIRTLRPLKSKAKEVESSESSSKYEVPVGTKAEVVTLSSAPNNNAAGAPAQSGGTATSEAPLSISSGIPLLQVAPDVSGSATSGALALPVNEAQPQAQVRPARKYDVNEVVKTDENQVVGKKIVEDSRYAAHFYSITETPSSFSAVFFHKNDQPLDIWIEGAGKSSTNLSKSKAAPYEEVTLTVEKVNGKVPYFKLHIGEASEIFEFFPLRKSIKLGKIQFNSRQITGDRSVQLQNSVVGKGQSAIKSVISTSPISSLDKSVAVPESGGGKVEKISSPTVVSGPVTSSSPKPFQAIAHKKFLLPSSIVFTFDDATLTAEGKAAIADVVEAIKKEKRWYALRVDGFTDSLGSEDYNVKLGLRRAVSVASHMVTNNGIDPAIVFVKSSGENDPIASNETEEGRTLNRRAEIVLFVQKED